MPTLQIRNLPQEIYDQLKESADNSRRSLNQEAITLLERGLHVKTDGKVIAKNNLLRHLVSDKKSNFCSEDAIKWVREDREGR